MKFLTEKNWKLELIQGLTADEFVKDCKLIYNKSRKMIGYNEITVDLGDDDISIANSADWHIGNEMTRMDIFGEDTIIIKDTPRQFVILDGDYTDNFDNSNYRGGMYEAIISLQEAKGKVMNAVDLMKEKIIGIVQGCHDEWFHKQDSWEFAQYLAAHCDGYWLGFRGVVNIILGEQTYQIYVRHKYSSWSKDNRTIGMLKKARKMKENIDVFFSAHHHYPDIRQVFERERQVTFITTSGYKPYDRFTEHKDIEESPILIPAVRLSADRHKVTPYMNFRDLADEL